MKFIDIFAVKGSSATVSPMTNINSPTTSFIPGDGLQEGESYNSFGKRACMYTNGNPLSLRSYLQRIYQSEKAHQLNDVELQKLKRKEIQDQLNDLDSDITNRKGELNKLEIDIKSNEDKISILNEERQDLKNADGESNKHALVKFYIGVAILTILTVYLFIFYSSTFSSAFIKGPETVEDAIFNPEALVNAFHEGFMKGLFLLTVPIIFLGLGYGLHYFMEQKNKFKYFKVVSLLVVTFLFDCILAVKIAEYLYNLTAANMWESMPPFNLKMAFSDINVWAVIFCGFIVYMIWAIVFDMTITAYGECRSNKGKIEDIDQKINKLKESIAQILKNKEGIITLIDNLLRIKGQLNQKISNPIYSPSLIKQAFADFYSGWNSIIGAVGLTSAHECQKTYDEESNILLGNNNTEISI